MCRILYCFSYFPIDCTVVSFKCPEWTLCQLNKLCSEMRAQKLSLDFVPHKTSHETFVIAWQSAMNRDLGIQHFSDANKLLQFHKFISFKLRFYCCYFLLLLLFKQFFSSEFFFPSSFRTNNWTRSDIYRASRMRPYTQLK